MHIETQAVPQIVLKYRSLGYIQFLPTKEIFIMPLNKLSVLQGFSKTQVNLLALNYTFLKHKQTRRANNVNQSVNAEEQGKTA